MTNQGAHIAALQAALGGGFEGHSYEGLWHAYWDGAGVAAGTYNERMLAWINTVLSASHEDLSVAQQAYAVNAGFYNWSSMDDLTLA